MGCGVIGNTGGFDPSILSSSLSIPAKLKNNVPID